MSEKDLTNQDEFWTLEDVEAETQSDDLAQIWHERGYSWPSGRKIDISPPQPNPIKQEKE